MRIHCNKLKSKRLKQTRGVSFEEIVKDHFIGFQSHPRKEHQTYMLFERKGYVWVAPFVAAEGGIFLKTLFPHRKLTKLYRQGKLL